LAAGVAAAVPAARIHAGTATERIVLGAPDYAGQYGRGWGKVKPRLIDNGGVPSGRVIKIRWRRWGKRVARGRGETYIYRPNGGYYGKRGAIQLRAFHRGTCPGTGGQRAYTQLRVRVVKRPGGRFGSWFRWAGTKDICTFR
jgi:hypothetical protein